MQSQKITRRNALAGAGAAAGALALTGPALAYTPNPDKLAMLIDRYYAETAAFNTAHHETDAESDAHAEDTYEKTIVEMTGVPATTAAGALAAFAFIESELNMAAEFGGSFDELIQSLLLAVRGYIEQEVRS